MKTFFCKFFEPNCIYVTCILIAYVTYIRRILIIIILIIMETVDSMLTKQMYINLIQNPVVGISNNNV